ncbi:MAG: helix-turn-helix domain-containing protein [Candidatus Aenigmarchaeota archaeon]|nr:helix-turn-helix domain-containing protein [Candidatus Aenigmarchaeota archaeon]
MNENEIMKDNLAKKICGEIVLSEKPGVIIKKWRNIFKVSQREIADEMGVMPSVLSDYESGRRKSPGIKIIRKIVDAMIKVSERKGDDILREFYTFPGEDHISSCILDIKEFKLPVKIKDFCKKAECILVAREDLSDKEVYGYSLIDSMKAIIELSPTELVKIYGLTTNRALIFTNVTKGRSPMVAIKVTNLRPSLVVFQGPDKVDELAKRIGEIEGISIAITKIKDKNTLKNTLKRNFNGM